MQRRPRTAVALFAVLLGGCQVGAPKPEDHASLAAYEEGALVLHRAIAIPPNRRAVYIQDGRLVGRVNPYRAHCSVALREPGERRRRVGPEAAPIAVITRSERYVAGEPVDTPTQPSRFDFAAYNGLVGPAAVEMTTAFELQSERAIARLACSHWDDPAFPRHLTPGQIHAALGDLLSLRPAGRS